MSRSSRSGTSSPSPSFYVVLLFVVAPLYAAGAFWFGFVLYALWTGRVWTYTLQGRAMFLWAVLEVIFSVYYRVLARRVTATPPRPPADFQVLQKAFARVLKAGLASRDDGDNESIPYRTYTHTGDTSHDEEQDWKERGSVPRPGSPGESLVQLGFNDPRARDFRKYMQTWFHKKPWAHIRSHEMRQWVYWSSFNTHLPPENELSPVHKTALDEALTLIQRRAGAPIKQGSNPKCKPLLLTLDPVSINPRPLAFYTLVWGANYWIKHSLRHIWGLQYGRSGDFEYLLRLPKKVGAKATPRPLVFIHGLGLGLLQYHCLLRDFLRFLPSHPILIPLQPHISQDIFHPRFLNPLSREESVRYLTQLIKDLGWNEGIDVLSHSNGSFFHAWMLKSCPDLVKRSCFVDPVTFCSWEGDVCYNFVYQPCLDGIELIIRYFVGTELGVANVIQRHFDWSSNSLWYEEIPDASNPRKTIFVLGGEDAIVDAERVCRYLRSHGVRKGLWFNPKGRHGQALIAGGEGIVRVVEWLLDQE